MPLLFFDKVSINEFLGVWKIDESSDFFLNCVRLTTSEKGVFNSFKNESRKLQWLSCRVLVNEFMNKNGQKGSVFYGLEGEPQLTTGAFISITHTPRFSAVIISENKHVGVDIEKISERILKIKSRMASDEELKIAGDNLQNLITLWASKEAIYKACGIKDLNFINDIHVDLSSFNNNCFSAEVNCLNVKKDFILKRIIIEDHILIYLIDN